MSGKESDNVVWSSEGQSGRSDVAGKASEQCRSTRSRFVSGALAGGVCSPLLLWMTHQPMEASSRLLGLVTVGLAIYGLRRLMGWRPVQRLTALAGVVVGGFMISTAAQFSAPSLRAAMAAVGATAFLVGITTLIRARNLAPQERSEAVDRVVTHERAPQEEVNGTVERADALAVLLEPDSEQFREDLRPQLIRINGQAEQKYAPVAPEQREATPKKPCDQVPAA